MLERSFHAARRTLTAKILATGFLAAGLGLVGCANVQPFVPDTAVMPAGALGGGLDPDVTAANLAYWAFADSGRTYGRPIEAARAAASLDYLAGEIYTSPRWQNVDALTKEQLLQGRQQLRTALGVRPGIHSQAVVDTLTSAGNALAAGDQAKAVGILNDGTFQEPGQQVLIRLSNLPYIQMANVGTTHLANELFQNDNEFLF